MDKTELTLLSRFGNGQHTAHETAAMIERSESTARRYLAKLTQAGLLRGGGSQDDWGKTLYLWCLNEDRIEEIDSMLKDAGLF